MVMQRSIFSLCLTFSITLILLAGLLLYNFRSHQLSLYLPLLRNHEIAAKPPSEVRVVFTETLGAHEEVIAGLVNAFGSHPHANVTLYQKKPRFGMDEIMANFSLPHPVPSNREVDSWGGPLAPHVVILTTCQYGLTHHRVQFDELLKIGKTHLICVVHHADRWNKESNYLKLLQPWIEKDRATMLFLSSHTADYFKRSGTTEWKSQKLAKKAKKRARVFIPVFPVSLPPLPDVSGSQEKDDSRVDEFRFALQGNYEATRRDFGAVFSNLHDLINSTSSSTSAALSATKDGETRQRPQRSVTLHLLGNGHRPEVPNNVKDNVIFNEKLSFHDYYSLLSQQNAILPAFASDDYYSMKASSTVPAALLSGAPLIAEQRLVEAYSYVADYTIWLQQPGESETDVMRRVMDTPLAERIDLKRRVRQRCVELVEENTRMVVEEWIPQILKEMKI